MYNVDLMKKKTNKTSTFNGTAVRSTEQKELLNKNKIGYDGSDRSLASLTSQNSSENSLLTTASSSTARTASLLPAKEKTPQKELLSCKIFQIYTVVL